MVKAWRPLIWLFFATMLLCCAQSQTASAQIEGQTYGPISNCSAGPIISCGNSYILDQLSSYPPEALSVRQLTASQYLPAYNQIWRRSSDNATAQIGFVNGVENVAQGAAFCAGTNAYLVTWKNQGSLGSSGDATQATAASQPQVCASGVVETQNGVPAVYFGGSQYLTNSTVTPFGASATFFSVVQSLVANGTNYPAYLANSPKGDNAGPGGAFGVGVSPAPYTPSIYRNGVTGSAFSSNLSLNTLSLVGLTSASGLSGGSFSGTGYINGAGAGSVSISGFGAQTAGFAIGLLSTTNFMNAKISEMILQYANSPADKATYDLNAAAFFGIPGVTQ